MTIRERLLANKEIDGNGCWRWQLSKYSNGYARIALGGGKGALAHRASFKTFKCEIPDGLVVCHPCDVRDCINPDHLWVGTKSQNTLDAVAKGRMSTVRINGEAHPSSKLTELNVRAILEHLDAGKSKKSLSKQYGVSQRAILLIARNQSWKHIERA